MTDVITGPDKTVQDPPKDQVVLTGTAAPKNPPEDLKPDSKPDPPKDTKPADPLQAKLEGDKIPEKLRGKTVAELLEMQKKTEGELTKANTANSQWAETWKASQAVAAQPKPEDQYNPMNELGEDTGKAVNTLIGFHMKPIYDGLGLMMKEVTRSMYPDFDQHEKRATELYENMTSDVKMAPNYGWNFAYKMAKAEAMPTPNPAANTATLPKPDATTVIPVPVGTTAASLTDEQKYWANKMGLTSEEYIKYTEIQTPSDKEEDS